MEKKSPKSAQAHQSLMAWLVSILKGALVGVGAILPGISGGVLCVALGIYQPIMDALAHPIRAIKTRFWYYVPLGIGLVLGVLGLSKILAYVLDAYEPQAMWAFIGLIMGTFPALYRETGLQGRPKSGWISLGISFCAMLIMIISLSVAGTVQITPNFFWWLFAGVLWGVGLIVPGMSPSSVLIFLGLYQPMTNYIGNLNMGVILPIGLGMVIAIALLVRSFEKLLDHRYPIVMHAILGFVLASTLGIIPMAFTGIQSFGGALVCIVCFTLGAVLAWWMSKLSAEMEKK